METIYIKSEVKHEDDFNDEFFTEEEIKVRYFLLYLNSLESCQSR